MSLAPACAVASAPGRGGGRDSGVNVSSEVLAAFELERLLHRASATRFERVPSGFVCANADLPMVWDASRVQVEPDCEPPTLERLRELAELPSTWHPELRHREVFLSHSDANRELAYSLARPFRSTRRSSSGCALRYTSMLPSPLLL